MDVTQGKAKQTMWYLKKEILCLAASISCINLNYGVKKASESAILKDVLKLHRVLNIPSSTNTFQLSEFFFT